MDAADIFRDYLRAHARFDFRACRRMLAPEARIYYNYRSIEQTFSAAEAYAAIEPMVAWLTSMRFEFDRPSLSADRQFAVQATAHAMTRGGRRMVVPVIYMGRIDDAGRIVEYQEYLDPAALAPLLAEMEPSGA